MCKAVESMMTKVEELVSLKAMMEDLQAEIDALQDEVKAYMESQEAETMESGSHIVTFKEVVSKRVDTAGLKKLLGADALEPYTKVIISKRFTIK